MKTIDNDLISWAVINKIVQFFAAFFKFSTDLLMKIPKFGLLNENCPKKYVKKESDLKKRRFFPKKYVRIENK